MDGLIICQYEYSKCDKPAMYRVEGKGQDRILCQDHFHNYEFNADVRIYDIRPDIRQVNLPQPFTPAQEARIREIVADYLLKMFANAGRPSDIHIPSESEVTDGK